MKSNKLLFTFLKTSSPVAYSILSVGMGTRNENPEYNGLAHLTEHMLFKGTPFHTSVEISNMLERVGGDMNAFTTKERIVLYSTTLKEDIAKAIRLIFEVAFSSSFPSEELRKEKVVVCDEIITYQDSPTELLYDTFENELFAGTPLGYSILGEKKTLSKISSIILKKGLEKFFVPNNMTLVVAGNFEKEMLYSMVESELKKWREGASLHFLNNDNLKASKSYIPLTSTAFIKQKYSAQEELSKGNYFNKTVDKKLRQAHCIIGCSAYSYYNSKERTILSLITNILGGPALNSRLSLSLREKHALVYNVEASYISYKDTGTFSIYFGCEREFFDKCISLIKKEIEKLIKKPMSEKALAAAKKQMIGQLLIASDNVEAQCLAKGKSLLLKGEIIPTDQLRSNIEKITPSDVQRVAKEVLSWDRLSRLVFV